MIELQKKNNEVPDGIIVIYNDYIVRSEKQSFDELVKELSLKYKLKYHDVFSNAIQLLYYKKDGKTIISEDRKIDLFRLAQKKEVFGKLQRMFR